MKLSAEIRKRISREIALCLWNQDSHRIMDLRIRAIPMAIALLGKYGPEFGGDQKPEGFEEAYAEFERMIIVFIGLCVKEPTQEINQAQHICMNQLIAIGRAFSEVYGIPDCLVRGIYQRRTGRAFDQDVADAKAGDFIAFRRLAAAGKDWGEVSWYKKRLSELSQKQKAQIEQYLADTKLSRKRHKPKYQGQEDLEYLLGFFRDGLSEVPRADLRKAIIEDYPDFKRDLKFNPDILNEEIFSGSRDEAVKRAFDHLGDREKQLSANLRQWFNRRDINFRTLGVCRRIHADS